MTAPPRPSPQHTPQKAELNLDEFEVYRSGAQITLRHIPCGELIHLGKTPLTALIGLAAFHRDGGRFPAVMGDAETVWTDGMTGPKPNWLPDAEGEPSYRMGGPA